MSRDIQSDPTPPRPGRGGVYVHIPFCDSICAYCHFSRTARHDPPLRRRYARAVPSELDLRVALDGGRRFRAETLYIGGGTPSVMETDLFCGMIDGLRERLDVASGAEITAEANPESLTPDLAVAWRRAGINRLSLGVQSLQADVLESLGRRATPRGSREALDLAVASFEHVSADWILAPGVDPDALAADFAWARGIGVEHISFYILEVHPDTPLARGIDAGRLTRPRDTEIEAVYLAAVDVLADLGYGQYEVSNFALPGRESRHNSAYWLHRPYMGLGAAAHGYLGTSRYANMADIDAYLAAVERGIPPTGSIDELDARALELERLILPLRTVAGLPLDRVPLGAAELAAGRDAGLWIASQGRLRLTPKGFLRIDAMERLMADRLPGDAASS